MTPTQLIKNELIKQVVDTDNSFLIENNLNLSDISKDNIDDIFARLEKTGLHYDYMHEFRVGEYNTDIHTPYSRHYESRSVASEMTGGIWVGWTYWYGGGKYADPDSIDWMSEAYFLDHKEEEKTVIIKTFTKK